MSNIFKDEHLLEAIDRFLNLANESTEHFTLRYSMTILESIENSPLEWDRYCRYAKLGIEHIHSILNVYVSTPNVENADMLFYYLYELAYEVYFFNDSMLDIREVISNTKLQMNDEAWPIKRKIENFHDGFPSYITRKIMTDPAIDYFKRFNELSIKAQEQGNLISVQLKERADEAQVLAKTLEKYKDAFNFVGLHQGFGNILDKKKKGMKTIKAIVVLLGLLILAPLLFSLAISPSFDQDNLIASVTFLITLGSLEFILIYYFRITLSNYNDLKSHIMQLELRQTLCQFIQGYSDYAVNIRKDNKDALERFERIIFSDISSDDTAPSIFDGLETISQFIKSVKN
ncbi:conserved hypothetical protein [Vibrio chagasii]|nr:conserved hypothetical protein [Vibrio chagasii]